MNKEEYPESVIQLESESIEVKSYYFHNEGSNDYKNRYLTIEKIIDREENSLEGVWEEHWTEIFPGIETCKKNHYAVRIHSKACPVRVLMSRHYEYVSYDCYEHNSQSTEYYWNRYES